MFYKSVALRTTTILIVNLLLVSTTRKELKFWWRAYGGHYCFSKQTVTENWNLSSNPITALTIGRGCDSLPRNGRPNIGSIFTLKEAYSLELLLILGLVLMYYSDTSSSQSWNSTHLVPHRYFTNFTFVNFTFMYPPS